MRLGQQWVRLRCNRTLETLVILEIMVSIFQVIGKMALGTVPLSTELTILAICGDAYHDVTSCSCDPFIQQEPYADVYQSMYHHPSRGSYEHRERYQDGYSRDTSKYVSQYGGTTEIYNPASGRFKEFDYNHHLAPPAYGDSK